MRAVTVKSEKETISKGFVVSSPKQLRHVLTKFKKFTATKKVWRFSFVVFRLLNWRLSSNFFSVFKRQKAIMIVNRKSPLSNKRWNGVKLIVEISCNRWIVVVPCGFTRWLQCQKKFRQGWTRSFTKLWTQSRDIRFFINNWRVKRELRMRLPLCPDK